MNSLNSNNLLNENQSSIGTTVTPTEAATYYSLIIAGLIGGIGTFVLAELIKEKKGVPIKSLSTWTILFGIATAISVYSISKASK